MPSCVIVIVAVVEPSVPVEKNGAPAPLVVARLVPPPAKDAEVVSANVQTRSFNGAASPFIVNDVTCKTVGDWADESIVNVFVVSSKPSTAENSIETDGLGCRCYCDFTGICIGT